MLIEFSVSNYRSFRERQTFSMVAAPRLKKGDNVFTPKVKGEKLPDLLKVAAIYGPNASGKSNLIKVFEVVRAIAGRQPSAQFIPLPVAPFRFNPQLADQPSRFEIHFIYEELRYQFDLALTVDRIVEERLTAFPGGKESLLYERQHRDGKEVYHFGAELEGGRDLHVLWKNATGPQVLFLTQAVANGSEGMQQLRKPRYWLVTGFSVFSEKMNDPEGSLRFAQINPIYAERISAFLSDVDVPVTNIRFEDVFSHSSGLSTEPKTRAVFTHQTALGTAEFDLNEESEGTKSLIDFWFPWQIRNWIEGNPLLVVDELDSSLHPEIVAALVAKHQKAEIPSQLIFTTHDTHLMDTKLLRRDQIWLTERDKNGATQLRSIHDFAGREGEDLEKRYYAGRYRGLPFIRKG
jgi:hypothetical protein